MAIFYIDLVSGNDANTGASWAQAWKTITSGATAARIAPGDEIRISKTGAATSLGQTAQWTNLSQTVTLTTSVNKHVAQAVGNTWTVSANVTGASNGARKFGATSQSLAIAGAFTTGKVAYVAVDGGGTQDFSSYQKVSFWIYTSAAVAASTLSLRLCSDAIGDVTVNNLAIPALPIASTFYCIEIDNGAALGASIQSVALYADLDPGAVTLLINNIVAGNTITHKTPIGKNDGKWWAIQSIDGATLKIDQATNTTASGRGYYGVTENVTTYYMPGILVASPAGAATIMNNMALDSGSYAAGRIKYSGGWNTATSLQDGETWFDLLCYNGYAFQIGNLIEMEKLSAIRASIGVYGSASFVNGSVISYFSGVCCQFAIYILGCRDTELSYSHGTNGIYGWYSNGSGLNYTATECSMLSTSSYGMYTGYGTQLIGVTTGNNATGSISVITSGTYNEFATLLRDTVLDDATEVTFVSSDYDQWVWSFHHDDTPDNNWGFASGATVNWQTGTVHLTEPGAWKVAITSSARGTVRPAKFKLCELGIEAGSPVTFRVWVKKDHATNVGAKIYIEGGSASLDGISYTEAIKANDTNWEQLTITFTSTEDGVCSIWAESWYIAGNSNTYFGTIDPTQ